MFLCAMMWIVKYVENFSGKEAQVPKAKEVTNEERFWLKVKITPDGCWEWEGCCSDTGYGVFQMDGKTHNAHKLSFLWAKGKVKKGLCVCHSCDNRKCVRPAHLFLGTRAKNNQDRDSKNRQYRPLGERNVNAKLTEQTVRKIRLEFARCKARGIQRMLAKKYGVSESRISQIVRGLVWSHI